jgi:DNA processing protein
MSAPEHERLARLALSQLFEPGDHRIAGLAAQLGPGRLLEMLRGGQHNLPKVDVAERLRGVDPARQLEVGQHIGMRYVVPGDDEWPEQIDPLDEISPLYERTGAPIGLWVRGPLTLDVLTRSVAIVGSRAATTYGADVAADMAADIGRAGYTVVSGGAYGVDIAAHRGAISAGTPTVCFVACGADRVYPPSHLRLFDILAREGAIVSEQAPGAPPTRLRFLSRNRLIAASACGTVIVEASRRSGARNTASWTTRLSRPLMGVPGPVTSAASEGVHRLLRSGEATVVTNGAEVLEMVGAMGEHLVFDEPAPRLPRDQVTQREQEVLDAMPAAGSTPIDEIARACGISIIAVEGALRVMRDRGLVTLDEDGWCLTADALRTAALQGTRRHAAR